uniref:HECT domain-containing protein n=1 Tax=Peronospora matthiolae TaxID=2874970 RepID=A0AAV1U203_9STRA
MDMRSKAYPQLPEGDRLRLVLPRTGDLRFRSKLPADFARSLYIHADPRRRFCYARFQLRRKFIVMSTKGDLYVKNSVTTYSMSDLPNKNVLNMPRMARGDPVKVLDLVQCSRGEGHHWELAFTRWRNGMETWLPVEVLRLFAPRLLQEFYVNSINSWAFYNRLQAGNLSAFQTEVELWLFHSEFQDLYEKLRQIRTGGSATMSHSHAQAARMSDHARVKLERLTGSVHSSHTLSTTRTPYVTGLIPTPPTASNLSEVVIEEYEQRRLARERQETLDQNVWRHLHHQQQVAEQGDLQQKRLECERRLQAERQKRAISEELEKRQKENQQRLQKLREQERVEVTQQQQRSRPHREKNHGEVRCEPEQVEPDVLQKHPPVRHSSQETATRTELRDKTSKSSAVVHSVHQPKGKGSTSIWTAGCDEEYAPPSVSGENDDSAASADSQASECRMVNLPRKRRRKRLLYSQVGLDDDEDFPELSQPPSRQNVAQASGKDDFSDNQVLLRNKKQKQSIESSRSEEKETANCCLSAATTSVTKGNNDATKNNGDGKATDIVHDKVDDDGDEDSDDDSDDGDEMDLKSQITCGKIRCVCGSTSVGRYRGLWLQCSNAECSVWEHADCVGVLIGSEKQLPSKYRCTRCDSDAHVTRCASASQQILDWLFQCCDSRNLKQLMDLLKGKTGAANIATGWKNVRLENRTLAMHASYNGLAECLSYLLDECKVDIFATDLQSRNTLHFAAQGGSVGCCRILLKHDQRLLLHPDLCGRMPFHRMLQSSKVNKLCVPLMQEDQALIGMGDLDCNFPIHYACQAVNHSAVRICQLIVAAQPSMLQEKSGEGLHPLMILCKSADTDPAQTMVGCSSEVVKSVQEIISLMLGVDVFGDCLNQQAPNGWSLLHFAAASGNYELVTYLCNIGLLDVSRAAKGSEQTALHIAAQENRVLCVRALLSEGFDVMAKDTYGRIPMMYTDDVECIQELMHYKLTKQLSRLHRMLGKYKQRELIRRWQRLVARDPVCFDILNDWCRSDTERIERMEGLLLSNPFLLRLDNKIKHIRKNIIPSVKQVSGQCSTGFAKGTTGIEKLSRGQKKLAFVFLRGDQCFWKQFVGMAGMLEPEHFRLPMVFSIKDGGGNSQDLVNCCNDAKPVLVRLAADLLKKVPSILVRGSSKALKQEPLFSDKQELRAQLLDFYLLGELTAHFVLYEVPLGGTLDYASSFLRCIGCKGKYQLASDKPWETVGRSFAAGFDAVLPATLEIFHADDLRVLFNGPHTCCNALQIDWTSAVDWDTSSFEGMGDKGAGRMKAWLPRLVSELVEEEQQLILLFTMGTYLLVNDRSFQSKSDFGRITIALYPGNDNGFHHDAMHPAMEHNPDILRLPSYSCYEAFKKGMLTAIRHADHAFLPE